MFTRRTVLAGGTGMLLTACAGNSGAGRVITPGPATSPTPMPSPSPTQPRLIGPGLHAIASTRGLRFGSATAWSQPGADAGSFNNPAYAALLEHDCGLLVAENELKWQWTRPSATEFRFAQMDAIADYATRQRMALRGHTLFWLPQKWYPQWLVDHDFGPRPAVAAEALLTNHVETVCARYGTRIYSYDVVNEAIEPETGEIRDTVMTRAMGGEALLDHMFHLARANAPHAELVYNDYMSWELTGVDQTHMRGVLRLLEGFRARGVPVDTLGIQSHIRVLKPDPVGQIIAESTGPWRAFLDAVVGMGYKLAITEFDVNDQALPEDYAIRDRAVADFARGYLDLMLSYPQLTDVLAWGLCDRYTWLTGFDPREGGTVKRGTPYDTDYQPKLLYTAIAEALAAAPPRAAAG